MREQETDISGNSVRLVDFGESMITREYLGWLRDQRVNRFLLKPGKETTLEEARDYCRGLMDSPDDLFLAILALPGGRHIGNVRIGPIDRGMRACQYGMMIGDVAYHGKGVGTEVVALAVEHCFGPLGLDRVWLHVPASHQAAIRIYEKNGFQVEERLPGEAELRSGREDMLVMARRRFDPGA